jgi:hypothetical protein
MERYEQTSMGGSVEAFLTTHWSVIDKIAADGDTPNQVLINELLKRYWKPVYCFLRHKGYDNEQAKDLTQGFFEEVVLGRELIQQAEQARGRFRTFLLAALEQYLARVHRKETARKRILKDKLVQLDQIDPAELPEPVDGLSPKQSFNYAWVSALLDQVLSDVKRECCEQGMETHWFVFRERIVEPMLNNAEPVSLTDICEEHWHRFRWYNLSRPWKSNFLSVTFNGFPFALRS